MKIIRRLLSVLSNIYRRSWLSYYGKLAKILYKIQRACHVLDLGCGFGVPMLFIRSRRKVTFSVAIDIKVKRVKYCVSKGIHDCGIVADVRYLPVRKKSFDIVLCLDLIEHLCKKDGLKLLIELDRIAKKQIIVHTPNGFYAVEGDVFDRHKSGWSVDDFRRRGFKVWGDGGFRLPGNRKISHVILSITSRKFIWAFFGVFDYTVGNMLVFKMPRIASQLLAVKEIGEER